MPVVQHYSGMTDGLRLPDLCVPAVSRQPALILRPWRAADTPALAAEMSREYPSAGMWSRPDERPVRTALPSRAERRAGPASATRPGGSRARTAAGATVTGCASPYSSRTMPAAVCWRGMSD